MQRAYVCEVMLCIRSRLENCVNGDDFVLGVIGCVVDVLLAKGLSLAMSKHVS